MDVGCGCRKPHPGGSKNSADLQIPNSVRLTEARIFRSQPIGKPSLTPDGARVRGRLVSHELRPTPMAILLSDSVRLGQSPATGDHRVSERPDPSPVGQDWGIGSPSPKNRLATAMARSGHPNDSGDYCGIITATRRDLSRVGSKNSADLQIPNSVRLTKASIFRSQPIGKPDLKPDAGPCPW